MDVGGHGAILEINYTLRFVLFDTGNKKSSKDTEMLCCFIVIIVGMSRYL